MADRSWRGGPLEVSGRWRDGGYSVGPLVPGGVGEIFGPASIFWKMAAPMGLSGGLTTFRMKESQPRRRREPPVGERRSDWGRDR